MILGLQNKKYKDVESLKQDMRYGKILILTDQDTDGSHIKGLLINFFHYFWPLLVKSNDFITCLQTPIVKCTKGKKQEIFYNIPEYEQWKETHPGWKSKYYKGLGTSSAKEAKDCFDGLTKKQVHFSADKEEDDEAIDRAFNKERADDRKVWIKHSTGKDLFLDNKLRQVPIEKFFNEEFVLFSIADNIRSIPNIMDGLKPSQRKVLYGCLKKNIKEEIKVDQIRGYIGEKAAYHHGDMSLNETIISMNHDFVGSNNINLLSPCGQLGTRLMGGKDAASPRYISTKLNEITRMIYLPDDDQLLNYLDDDGYAIEPDFYWPVIPMLLVNGTAGIGTGYSTDVPCYNPNEIITNIKELIDDDEYEIPKMIPWYKNFKGTICQKPKSENFISKGVWKRISRAKIQIVELPVGVWTEKYKEKLDSYIQEGKIENVSDQSSETDIDFTLSVSALEIDKWIKENKVEENLGLTSTIKASNMTVFNHNGKLIVVSGPEEILYEFFRKRIKLYRKRYKFLITFYEKKIKEVNSKLMFIQGIIDEKIKVFRIPKNQIKEQLEEQNFPKIENTYDYLLSMKIYSFTEEKMKEFEKELADMQAILDEIKSKTHKDLWKEDLQNLKKVLRKLS